MTAVLHMTMLMLGIALGMPTATHADEVPYVTTPTGVVDAMLSIATVGDKDYLFDLGSGDGRIVIAAAKQFHARGVGIEYDGTLIAQSRESAAREGVSDRVEFLQQDIFASDFRNASASTGRLGSADRRRCSLPCGSMGAASRARRWMAGNASSCARAVWLISTITTPVPKKSDR